MKRSRFDTGYHRDDHWPREWHWYTRFCIEPPFPWLGLLLFTAALLSGVVIVPVLAWLGFELIDQGLESFVRR